MEEKRVVKKSFKISVDTRLRSLFFSFCIETLEGTAVLPLQNSFGRITLRTQYIAVDNPF